MKKTGILVLLFVICSLTAKAQVKYDEGRIQILGVQLLQDYKNENTYYYLPQYPRLSVKADGDMELLCIKYVGEDDQPSGGLFHALVDFSLPEEMLEEVQTALEEEKSGAIIQGPVPLLPASNDGKEGAAGFQLVSAILSDSDGEESFTKSLITSGHAPLLPGSKSAIAANLSPEGATLLWNSFTGPTSDISATINASYEAWVNAYNAIVTAEMSVVYEHFSQIYNYQHEYTKRELRDIVDELKRDGGIKIEVFDRTKSLNVKSSELESILNLVTDKLVELMFDTKAGWSKAPEKETAVTSGQVKGRQEKGFFSKLFSGSDNAKYITDNQFVLKKRKDIQTNTFYLNLSKNTTVKVPVNSSGNLGGLFDEMGNDTKYFRIVDLNDADFQKRDVFFQIDGEYLDAFKSKINFVSINFKKEHGEKPATTKELFFNYSDIEKGNHLKSLNFPRLGNETADWLKYSYRVKWSMRGQDKTILIPENEDEWLGSDASVISLKPPFKKEVVEIDADRMLFKDAEISTALVEFASVLAGNKEKVGRVLLRADDPESLSSVVLYHDENEPVVYKITWISKNGTSKTDLKLLDTDYLFLLPPNQ